MTSRLATFTALGFILGTTGAFAQTTGGASPAASSGAITSPLGPSTPGAAAVATALSSDTPLPTGANTIGAVNQGNFNANAPWSSYANASIQAGGVSSFSRISSAAGSTNATLVKSTQGRLYRIFACNTTTTDRFIHFTNLATAPVPGTSAVFMSRPLPRAGAAGGLNCLSYDMADIGWSFSAGIGFWISTGRADTDTGALTAGDVTDISMEYK